MENIPELIVAKLKNEYHYEISPALEVRVHDLYDIGKIAESSDYDKIIYAIHNRRRDLFSQRAFIDGAMNVMLGRCPLKIRLLIIGSDLGESAFSALINIERRIKQSDNVTAFYNILAQSQSIAEKLKNPSFNYDEVLNADENELHYLVNKIDYYTVRRDLVEKTNIVSGNPFKLPFKDNTFDCIFLLDFQRLFVKSDIHEALQDVFRVTAADGFCFTDNMSMMISEGAFFMPAEMENYNYFVKHIKRLEMINDSNYTFTDAIDFYRNKKYQESAMILHSLIREKDEIDLDHYRLLLLIYIRQGDAFKIEFVERVLKLNNVKNADFDFIIGSYYFNRNDYSKSEKYLNSALSESPDLVFAEYYLALIEKMCGKIESSRKRFNIILKKIESEQYYIPELYSEFVSIDMISYIAKNEMEGIKV
ncbi:MAG: methyltransferase domain-containing protein [bacterium]